MKLIVLITTILLSLQSIAATSGTLILKGTVPSVLELVVNPETLAMNLPLDITQTNSLVGTVTEKSNSSTGYSVSITSLNQGKLVHETETSSVVNYSLRYNTSIVDLVNGSSFSEPTKGLKTRDLEISYTGVPHENLYAGDYSDTLTFTMTAN